MATLDDVKAQQAQTAAAIGNIGGDVAGLKTKIDELLAGNQGEIDAAVAAVLQEVSDGMAPIVESAQALADATPDAEPPNV